MLSMQSLIAAVPEALPTSLPEAIQFLRHVLPRLGMAVLVQCLIGLA